MAQNYLPSRWDYYEICCAHQVDTQVEHMLADVRQKGLHPGGCPVSHPECKCWEWPDR